MHTRPGFTQNCMSISIAYLDRWNNPDSQHYYYWLFCDESQRERIKLATRKSALAVQVLNSKPANESIYSYPKEWGGLYLRSGA
ncbi:hypothetical protein KR51_00019350 [Rubidibacter lacunae KORDI 51-2]|uniref:Uncharacterized protein n=1 Tax=Rubidibacter lacunae KORDI 51-2 TaxID=582515 RepID=U5D9V7_9CHRO|nr:hypothetical protein KR51_00019350 [Rubidibacter lacunae KORDI 51-2]